MTCLVSGERRRARSRRFASRGFTLTELMAVVAIMGVLAALALTAFHKRALQSDAAKGKILVRAITAAEERYRAENQVYLDVSQNAGWYPSSIIAKNSTRSFWKEAPDASTDPLTVRWATLGPDIRQEVEFVFMANAGLPTTAPTLATTAITLPANVAVEPWYVVQARADADGDGIYSYIAAASWSPNVLSVDDGE
jgi:prepilin-type N-terminal cleavage/methylation domain-containing protein